MSNALKVTAPEGLPFVDFEREFDAPVEAVFNAHRDPALVAKWLGPDGYQIDMAEWDFRSGGTWSYVHRDPEGNAYEFRACSTPFAKTSSPSRPSSSSATPTP
jgi:uncharacterized protein YndB with AHSA1/START domain